MNQQSQDAKQAGAAMSREIIARTAAQAGNADYMLVYMAMLLSGLLGAASAELGERAAFELWDLVKAQGAEALRVMKGGVPADGRTH